MTVQEVSITVLAIGLSIAASMAGAPDWLAVLFLAFVGSGLSCGFRFLDGQITGWAVLVLTFVSGVVGGIVLSSMLVELARMPISIFGELAFVCSLVSGKVVRFLATKYAVEVKIKEVLDHKSKR